MIATTNDITKLQDRIASLKASIAAIHYHAANGTPDKVELFYSILQAIHQECEEAVPELKSLNK